MNRPRFFCTPLLPGELELSTEDSQHASNVLRLKKGDHVELFDGQGHRADAELVEVRKRSVRVRVDSSIESCGELGDLEILVSLPKGDRQKVLVDGLTQLGVRKLTPLLCERSVAQPKESAIARLRKSVIESCKQCRRDILMEIGEPIAMKDLESWNQPSRLQCVAHPYGVPHAMQGTQERTDIHEPTLKDSLQISVAIGPEGGFTEAEVDQFLSASWNSITLGSQILRVEMAALKVAACLGN